MAKAKLKEVSASKTKNFKRAGTAEHIRDYMDEFGVTAAELGNMLGYGDGAASGWPRDNDAPEVTLLAIEALRARSGGAAKQPVNAKKLVVAQVPQSDIEYIMATFKHMGVKATVF